MRETTNHNKNRHQKIKLSCQIFNFWAKPMEPQSALVQYYSSSRSAQAANLCSTSHLILRGSAPKRSKLLLGAAAKAIFQPRPPKSDIFKISSPGLWAAADN